MELESKRLVAGLILLIGVSVGVVIVILLHYGSTSSSPGNGAKNGFQPSSSALLSDCTQDRPGNIEPARITLACADGTEVAEHLTWTRWSVRTANANATVYAVRCVPNCAQGQEVAYPARLVLSEPVITGSGQTYFTRITLYYPHAFPDDAITVEKGSHRATFSDCLDHSSVPYVPTCPRDLQ